MAEHNTRMGIPYPTGILKQFLRAPLLAYRMGVGDVLNAAHIMVLTTRGRKSGEPRLTPIEYRRHGSKLYVLSGWGERPQWYQNLLADPLATAQMGHKRMSALADPVTDPAEALRALNLFRRVAPGRYDAVLGRLIEEEVNALSLPDLSHQFTIMRLDLLDDEPTLPGVEPDMVWLWPIVGTMVVMAVIQGIMARHRANVRSRDDA